MNQQTNDSILLSFKPAAIATLANRHAIKDLEVFFTSLQLWSSNELPPVYLYCCSKVVEYLDKHQPYKGPLFCRVILDSYSDLTRKQMEQLPSVEGKRTLFHEFTEEKCGLMEWAYKSLPEEKQQQGVLFCDADICWLGPIPSILSGKTLGLSPHMIHEKDEALYGMYNAGFFWTNQSQFSSAWKMACKTSRFFEQAALETLFDFTPEEECFTFGPEVNYGWWRMFQSPNGLEQQKKQWLIRRDESQSTAGLYINGKSVVCIHTHWKTQDAVTHRFNTWILEKLEKLKGQTKIRLLLKTIHE